MGKDKDAVKDVYALTGDLILEFKVRKYQSLVHKVWNDAKGANKSRNDEAEVHIDCKFKGRYFTQGNDKISSCDF